MQTRREAATGKTWEQKQDEKAAGKEGEWGMIKVIERDLVLYACFDFFIQLFAQLPLVPAPPRSADGDGYSLLEIIGLRKIWREQTDENHGSPMSYERLINGNRYLADEDGSKQYVRHGIAFGGLNFDLRNFLL